MPRITITVSEETLAQLKEFANEDRRSLTVATDLLLQSAIREKLRKRKPKINGQEDSSQYYPTDAC